MIYINYQSSLIKVITFPVYVFLSLCLNVGSLCEQAYCFSPLWSNTCYVFALKEKTLILPSWRITCLMLWNIKLFDMNVKFWKDNLNSTGYLHTSLSLAFVSRLSDYCQLPFPRKEPNSKWLTCLNRCALKHQITFQEMLFKSFLCFNILSHLQQA